MVTLYIANKADSGLLNGSSLMEFCRNFCFGYFKNVSAVPKQKLRLSANLIGSIFEIPYLPYTQCCTQCKKDKEKRKTVYL